MFQNVFKNNLLGYFLIFNVLNFFMELLESIYKEIMNLISLTTNNKQPTTKNKQQGSFYLFSACEKAPSVRKGGVF